MNSLRLPRKLMRELAAEFLGVMILVMFGNGASCQTQLSRNTGVASVAYGVSISSVLAVQWPPLPPCPQARSHA